MVLDNKLGLTNSAELAKQEEILTKKRAKELFESGKIEDLEIGTFQGLSDIHQFLFQDIYDFATRIWLDLILKNKLHKIVDWNQIDKDEYLNAMIRSTVSTNELKYLIQKALTDDLGKEQFFKGIDASYYYEGYYEIKTEDL